MSEGDIRSLLRLGVVEAEKVGGIWLVPPESVEDLEQVAAGELDEPDCPHVEEVIEVHHNEPEDDGYDDSDDDDYDDGDEGDYDGPDEDE